MTGALERIGLEQDMARTPILAGSSSTRVCSSSRIITENNAYFYDRTE